MCIHVQIGSFLAAMKTEGEEAIGVLCHAAIAHGVDPSAIVGMGNVLSSQKEMGMKSQPRNVKGTGELWMLLKCRLVPDELLWNIKKRE